MWRTIDPDRRAFFGQVVRYAITGVIVTAFQSVIYWTGVYPLALAPLVAHGLASAAAVVLGYVVHSRYSFRDQGARSGGAAAFGRFVLVSLFGIALNSVWVWLLTGPLALPEWTPILAYLLVTPALVFALNRAWVFR